MIIGLACDGVEFSRNHPQKPMVARNGRLIGFIVGYWRVWDVHGFRGNLRRLIAGTSEYRRAREDTADCPGAGPKAGGNDPAGRLRDESFAAASGQRGGRAGVKLASGRLPEVPARTLEEEKVRRAENATRSRADLGVAIAAFACASAACGTIHNWASGLDDRLRNQ